MGNASVTAAALSEWCKRADAPLIVDVRRPSVFESSKSVIPGAQWRNPYLVGEWTPPARSDRDIVVYCAAGHEISQGVRHLLHSLGHRAWYLAGGLEAWIERGGALVPSLTTEHVVSMQAA